MSYLNQALELQSLGTPLVQPEYISEEQRKELQECIVNAIKGNTSRERREAREVHVAMLERINPELIYDKILMYNGRMNYRTVGDVLSLCKSGM